MAPVYKFSSARSLVGPNTYYSSVLAGNSVFSPIPPSAYDLLATETVTGTPASVTFSNLNTTYGADYQHLQIRAIARGNRASNDSDGIVIQFNLDTGSSYARHALYSDGSGIGNWGLTGQNYINAGLITGSTTEANSFDGNIIDILEPFDATKNTVVRAFAGRATQAYFLALLSGLWLNTSAITDITLKPQAGTSIQPYSRFALYGLRKGSV